MVLEKIKFEKSYKNLLMTNSTKIGSLEFGKPHPVRIQSMTNTDTADVMATVNQILELVRAGSELVRITVDSDESSLAVPKIIEQVRKFSDVPIVWDFHYNGHVFLTKYPEMAESLDKYRINPGNVWFKDKHDENFEIILWVALKNDKAIRIWVNGWSLDQEMLQEEMDSVENAWKSSDEIFIKAMVKSAITSADYARKFWIKREKIILSVKHSDVNMMVAAYRLLDKQCDYFLHLGLTEAGGWMVGLISSSIALGTLLQEGIGDTIRVSITPQSGESRTKEVLACRHILQSIGLRQFAPKVVSCPGCGRTTGNSFSEMAEKTSLELDRRSEVWKKKYPWFKNLHIAVMWCVVNGLWEAKSADIWIFFPWKGEGKHAVLIIKGVEQKIQASTLEEIQEILFDWIEGFLERGKS